MSKIAKVKVLESLTPEQEAQFDAWVEKWVKVGTSTKRADRKSFERAVRVCYASAELAPPERIIWVDSPLEAVTEGPIEGFRIEFGREPSDQERAEVVRDNWSNYFGGQFWCDWVAKERFYAEVCGLLLGDGLDEAATAYADTVKSAGWWWPHERFVVVSERPIRIVTDEAGRLHCETGPAIVWPNDKMPLYYLRGVEVPREWIEEKDKIDPKLALTYRNIEQRSVLAWHLGWARVLDGLGSRVIEKDPDPAIGTLFEVDLPDAPGQRFVRVECPTGRTFVLAVPRTAQTALEGGAMSYRVPVDVYRKLRIRA